MGGCKVGPGESSDPHLVQPLPGHDTRALQAWLGHKNILHTVRYTELAPRQVQERLAVGMT